MEQGIIKEPRILIEDYEDLRQRLRDVLEEKDRIEKETDEKALERKTWLEEEVKRISDLLYAQYGVTLVQFMIYEGVQCRSEKKPDMSDKVFSEK